MFRRSDSPQQHDGDNHDQRSYRLELISLALTALSLLIAVVALVISIEALNSPRPFEPTLVPTFGKPERPRLLKNAAEGRKLLDFIIANTGRKIRIYVRFDANYYGYFGQEFSPEEETVTIPSAECPEVSSLKRLPPCIFDELRVNAASSKDRQGIGYDNRPPGWVMNGYYAVGGFIGKFGPGHSAYAVTPLTDAEAVT